MSIDRVQFSVIRLSDTSVNLPSWSISGKLVDTDTQEVIKDFTGVNAIVFPEILNNLNDKDRKSFEDMILSWIIDYFTVNP